VTWLPSRLYPRPELRGFTLPRIIVLNRHFPSPFRCVGSETGLRLRPSRCLAILFRLRVGGEARLVILARCLSSFQINPKGEELRPEEAHRPRAPGARQLTRQPGWRSRGSSSESRCTVPVCKWYLNPSRSFNRTCGSRSMLRTYPAFIPCSATSQNWFPIRPSPTGVRRGFPVFRPFVSSNAYPQQPGGKNTGLPA
jgi:hypothetical protein